MNPASWLPLAAGGELTQPSLRLFMSAYFNALIKRLCEFRVKQSNQIHLSKKRYFAIRHGNFLPACRDHVRQAEAGKDGSGRVEGYRQRQRLHTDAENGEVPVGGKHGGGESFAFGG